MNREATMNLDEAKAAIEICSAVYSALLEAPEGYPSGHLYAHLCGKMSLDGYESMIGMMSRAGMVRKDGDLLFAVAPRGA